MPERRYRLIAFDWDGTLIDSALTIVECIQEASREMGLPVPSHERASHVIGLGLHDSLRIAVPELARDRYMDFAQRYSSHFLARENSMALFPGVANLLESLRLRGHQLAVATGKSRRGLDRALAASGLGPNFVATRCADETMPKPDPAMLKELMRELDVAPGNLLMIGDTSHDLEMARNAGVDSIGVSYGAHPAEKLRTLMPTALVSSVAELGVWIERHA